MEEKNFKMDIYIPPETKNTPISRSEMNEIYYLNNAGKERFEKEKLEQHLKEQESINKRKQQEKRIKSRRRRTAKRLGIASLVSLGLIAGGSSFYKNHTQNKHDKNISNRASTTDILLQNINSSDFDYLYDEVTDTDLYAHTLHFFDSIDKYESLSEENTLNVYQEADLAVAKRDITDYGNKYLLNTYSNVLYNKICDATNLYDYENKTSSFMVSPINFSVEYNRKGEFKGIKQYDLLNDTVVDAFNCNKKFNKETPKSLETTIDDIISLRYDTLSIDDYCAIGENLRGLMNTYYIIEGTDNDKKIVEVSGMDYRKYRSEQIEKKGYNILDDKNKTTINTSNDWRSSLNVSEEVAIQYLNNSNTNTLNNVLDNENER